MNRVRKAEALAITTAGDPRPAAVPHAPPRADSAGVVVVSDIKSLALYVSEWEDLAAEAVEPNVFYEHWMLMPALSAFGRGKEIKVVLVFAPNPADPHRAPFLCGLFPLECERRFKGLIVTTLSLWKHDYCYLCTPLVRAGYEQQCLEAFLDWLARDGAGCQLMEFRSIGSEGPFHRALVDEFNRRGTLSFVSECFTRAMFRPARDPDDYIRKAISGSHRKEMRRKESRLSEKGRLEYATLTGAEDPSSWIDEFLELEASGWKGKQGSALACNEADSRFFTEVMAAAFWRGRLEALALRLDGKSIAQRLYFVAGRGAFAFKTAFDEQYHRYSPGVLLQMKQIYDLHARPDIEWMDSGAAPASSIGRLWTDRRAIQNVVIGTGRGAGDLVVSLMPLFRWIKRKLRLNRASRDQAD
jgi:CelD/BcsL family acetyltransferase involved in cellulose biosynthesis